VAAQDIVVGLPHPEDTDAARALQRRVITDYFLTWVDGQKTVRRQPLDEAALVKQKNRRRSRRNGVSL
jgi:hypothetical protein